MPQYWMIDPANGDYEQEGGAPVETDELTVPAFYRVKIPRGGWMYAPDSEYGSGLGMIKKNPLGGDTTRIESTTQVALKPLLSDGRATSITVQTIFAARNGVGLDIKIRKQRGVVDNLQIPSLGV